MITPRESLTQVTRVVVKIGTNVLMGGEGNIQKEPDRTLIETLSRQVIGLSKIGKEIILVSSGAIGFGMAEMELTPPLVDVAIRQSCAAIGQPILMQVYKEVFNYYHSHCAQILLTSRDFKDNVSYQAFSSCIATLLQNKVTPIINENDSVAIEEIDNKFGDNDHLSAMVATNVNAELLILLTDVDALYDKNPHKYNDAVRIEYVDNLDEFIQSHATLFRDTGSMVGTGGMHTKLNAARLVKKSSCKTVIAGANQDNVLIELLQGKNIGTLIV